MLKIRKHKVEKLMAKHKILTKTELAEKMGISKSHLSLLLSNNYEPLKHIVYLLADTLNVSPADILIDESTNQIVEPTYNEPKSNITVLELFAGAGGLALGLEKAGLYANAYIEIDRDCCKTLKINRPSWNVIQKDIREVDFSEFKDCSIDVITGGFPCQAFSYAGKKLGFEDTRGTLFFEFARAVKELRPKLFVAENVRGILNHDGGKTFSTITGVLSDLGYTITNRILNATNYFVPQKRERVFIVGTLPGISFEFPKPYNVVVTLREALEDCPTSEGTKYTEKRREVYEKVPPGGYWRDLPEQLQKEFMGKSYYSSGGRTGMARRMSWDEPCLTLLTTPSQKQTERIHPDETRPFTIREYARIQTFPDEWEFYGTLASKYKQIGNAVPVKLAYFIGMSIRQALENSDKSTAGNISLD